MDRIHTIEYDTGKLEYLSFRKGQYILIFQSDNYNISQKTEKINENNDTYLYRIVCNHIQWGESVLFIRKKRFLFNRNCNF